MATVIVLNQLDPETGNPAFTEKMYVYLHYLGLVEYWCFGPKWCDLEHEGDND